MVNHLKHKVNDKSPHHQVSFLHLAVFRVIRVVPHGDDEPEGERVPLDGVEGLSGADPSAHRVNGEIGRLAWCAATLFWWINIVMSFHHNMGPIK